MPYQEDPHPEAALVAARVEIQRLSANKHSARTNEQSRIGPIVSDLSERNELRLALRNLADEVAGWRVDGLVEVGGWTKASALRLRLDEARNLLTKITE